ncbi:Lactose permease [Colletotrichum orbiculare MAFF 240422]|uniref:Lactose permease n=1 Tax=Colletotrichum orbiculare (strain 104-T / ATCC 96160 / CBS 514.97 / LARS 414 / MAFF 240422) TaxID=1213857 RepID=A0A484G3G3_COLOR|nr:Lactose permease [Colletotrichum orbiculare MAFF 240422]
MGFFKSKSPKQTAAQAAGSGLLAVLPDNPAPWYRTRHLLLLNLTLLVPMVSSASVGFDGAMMNGLQTLEQWRGYFGHPSAPVLGAMNAVYPVGKLMGLVPTTWLGDKYGRKTPMWAGFFLLLLGAALQAASTGLPMFIVSRWLLGAATAFIAQPAPILVTELAYPTQRGKISALYNTSFFCGAILAAWSTYGTFRLPSTWSWRIPSLLQGALPALQVAFFFWVPESPRWLVANGKTDVARQVLVRYHGAGDPSSPLVEYEVGEIEDNLRMELEASRESSYLDLLRTAPNRRRTLIAVIVGLGAQWTGSTVVSYYLSIVLNTVGITQTKDQALINGLLQVFNWLAAIFAGAMMVDRLGRRKLFLVSTAGMLACYVVWTVLTSVFARTQDDRAGYAVVAFIFVYYFFYDIAWSPLLMSYPTELMPYTLRGRGLTVSLGSTFVGLIVGQFLNPIGMANLGWRYYIVFCCILAVVLVLVWLLFPETKGRTLEQIAEVFDGKKHALGDDVGEEKAEDRDEFVEVENVASRKH